MGIGLGKRYWVKVVLHFYGTIEECIKFMQEHHPSTNKQWWELKPQVKVKKGNNLTCNEYMCDLVEES